MDKAILKKFAVESRHELMEKIRNKIDSFYINEEFKSEQKGELYILSNNNHSMSLTNDIFKKRDLLIKRINDLGFERVVEEAAYTWFNRIIAIRYMEINDILPLTKDNQSIGIRVLSSRDNTPDPEILKFSNLVNSDLDIEFKKEEYVELKNDNEKFKYVMLLICKKLGKVIPQVFGGITDYIDILIPDNLLNDTGFITKIINEVPESNYNQVEIIGWLYQYYNQTEKDNSMAKGGVYGKNDIPYVTQLFTPDWIVKYMVENSLGKLWIKHNEGSCLKSKLKYLVANEEKNDYHKINLNDICFLDPCCGSGHILVYAFEILYKIYLENGYNKFDISINILEHNIFGLDIDDRAVQLSILSVLLKAREYDKNIFKKIENKTLNIYSIQETNCVEALDLDILSENQKNTAQYVIDTFKNAKEIGSLLIVEKKDYDSLVNEIERNLTIFGIQLREKLLPVINVAKILSQRYDVVVTNPPYMNSSVMPNNLKKYILKNYPDSKTDLCTAFMETCLVKKDGYLAMINQHSWMFLSSFEKLRSKLLDTMHIDTMIHLGTRAFEEIGGEVVQTSSFVLEQSNINKDSIFYKLTELTDSKLKEEEFLNNKEKYEYKINQKNFKLIPGYEIIYWFSNKYIKIFDNSKPLINVAIPKQGLATGENNRFVREWYEVNINNTLLNSDSVEMSKNCDVKWYPYNKGGEYRKWYGNNDYIVNWENDGFEIKNFKDSNGKLRSRPQNLEYYFKEAITWSKVSGSSIAFRYKPFGHIFDVAGTSIFSSHDQLIYLLGLNNSKVIMNILKSTSPTLNYEVGQIGAIPVIEDCKVKSEIQKLVLKCIDITKEDWDSFETSWNFTRHPLLKSVSKVSTIRDSIANWNTYTYQQRSLLKHNEEELNKIFIDIYGLNDELTPEVDEKDITIRNEDKERDIKSFISYAVGCMFGRYSLDKDGLIYAGGDFDNIYQKYKKADGGWAGSSLSNYKYLNDNGNEIELSFEVDNDNIIPITDEAYFSDDIVERFKTFIKTVYGDNTFNENMDFIAEALGKKGTETSEETIRRYFVNDFFNDHVKMYQKRPIYWLLDSGKKNGFKALVYMHRYNENLIPKARLDYLHRVQTTYEKLLSDVNYKLTIDLSMTDKKEAKNKQADLNAKLNEIKEYDEKIAHIANQRISIDLDDGVKVNYEKFKDILAKIK